jgi:hypothetical protein
MLAAVACTPARDYTGVDQDVLQTCEAEARSLKVAMGSNDSRETLSASGQATSVESVLDDARLAREEQRKNAGNDLADWPLVVLIDQCLVENGQPISEEAAAELTRYISGEAVTE